MLSSINEYTYKTTPMPEAQGILQKRGAKDYPKNQEVCCETMSPSDSRSYTHQYILISMTA